MIGIPDLLPETLDYEKHSARSGEPEMKLTTALSLNPRNFLQSFLREFPQRVLSGSVV